MRLLDNRYRDYVGFPPLLRSGENDGKSFSDFYRASQIELFSALDNVLSQKAEETLTEFAAVKKADVQLQTQLGNRKGQIAANIIGAFAESQNSAFGWQVRAFGAENDTKGANAGIFFRRVDGESLYGINSFADYEKGDYGEFLRYGIGGELQNRYVAFAANLYLPITDDKHTGSTVAFSQKGYDANLRINIPQLDFLKVRADYYHFDGKYGGENDNGFRYGLEVQPIANLRIGAYYDDGGEKFGGDIVYVYNIAPPAKRESTGFAPDLFSPIVREYSQRIITATTGPQIQVLRTPTLTTTMTRIFPAMTFTTFMTMAGMTRIATTETPIGGSRAANALFTVRADVGTDYLLATTRHKFLLTLPPATTRRPWVLTVMKDLRALHSMPGVQAAIVIDASTPGGIANYQFNDFPGVRTYTITIVEGSEEFTNPQTTMTTFATTQIAPITTETPMMIEAMTITTRLTTFATSTITIGANIGAAKVDSHLPPSFPPSSFPPFPQVPKLALADPVILDRRAGIQHNRVAIIQNPRRQYAQ